MLKVYDIYETCELLGEVEENLLEVKKIAKKRYIETDGECAIYFGKDKNNLKFLETF